MPVYSYAKQYWQYVSGTALITCTLCSSVSYASSESLFTEEDYLSDIPEVVSATRLSQKLTEVPASITLITREMIDAAPIVEVADLFRLVPGMQVFKVSSNKFGVTTHGQSDGFPGDLEVMVDGRSIYLPMLSTVDWTSLGITLADISHIEVVRGSNVPAYGSNAFLGAINIVTRNPIEEEGGSVSTLVGSNNSKNLEWRYAGMGELVNYRISGGYRSNDGSDLYSDGKQVRFLNLSMSAAPTLNDTVELQLGGTGGYIYVGDGDDVDKSYERREQDSNYQYLKWNHVLSGTQDLQLTLYRNYLDLDTRLLTSEQVFMREESVDFATASFFTKLLQLDGVSLRADGEHGSNETYDIELQYTDYISEQLSLIMGAGYRLEKAASDVLLDSVNDITEERARAFASLQWQQDQHWLFNAGVMYEHGSAVADGRFSPRLAVNYLVSEETSLRAAFTKAYRIPSLLDANGATVIRNNKGEVWDMTNAPNHNLKAEQVESYELGFYSKALAENTEFDFRIFHERVRDGLTPYFFALDPPDQDGDSGTVNNTKQWEASGFELQYRAQPWDNGTLMLNYGFLELDGYRDRGVKVFSDGTSEINFDKIGHHAPQHTLSVLLGHKFSNGVSLSGTLYHMDDVTWVEGGSRDDYWRTDIKVSKTFDLDSQMKGQVALVVQNFFDKEYSEFYLNNRFPRQSFLKFTLTY